MKIFPTILVLFLMGAIGSCAQSQTSGTKHRMTDLARYLQVLHQSRSFQGEILVAKGRDILFHQAIGKASFEHGVSLKAGARYRIASISKTFTGTLILIAKQELLLRLEDKVKDYLPSLSPKFGDITIHQLLTHRSGLPHHSGFEDYWQTVSRRQFSTDQAIEEINKLDLLFEPGSDMTYSSPAYYVLATVLEAVYKDNFHQVLQEKILNPLQMAETGSAYTLDILPQLASGYHLGPNDRLLVAPYRDYSMLKGAGDLYSTAVDLLRWTNSFYDQEILNDEVQELFFTPESMAMNEKDEFYGYGWFIDSTEQKKYYHGGGTWGYSSFLVMYPAEKLTIIILSNVSTLPMKDITSNVEKIVFGQPVQMPGLQEEVMIEGQDLSQYCGKYISDSGQMSLTIGERKGGLYAQLAGRPPFPIYPKAEHQFFGKKVEIDFLFEWKADNIHGIIADRMGQQFHFVKESN